MTVNPNGFVGDVNNIADATALTKWGNVSRQSIDTVLSGGRISGAGLANKVAIPRIDLVIAGGFSPNRDGIDDKFIILRPGGSTIQLKIFNRWGALIYSGYAEEFDSYPYWDGSINNGSYYAQDGVYFYQLKGRKSDSPEIIEENGSITIFR